MTWTARTASSAAYGRTATATATATASATSSGTSGCELRRIPVPTESAAPASAHGPKRNARRASPARGDANVG